MPKVSIITTAYKHEKFIAQTIESILEQSFFDWELLIGDDSPDDSTWDVIQKYVTQYPGKIHAWHHMPNKGIVGNMNYLISQASPISDYIAFLEGDDIYTKDCLLQKIHIFENFPQVGIVYSDIDFINATGTVTKKNILGEKKIKKYQNKFISVDEYISLEKPLFISYSSLMIRGSLLRSHIPIQNLTGSKNYAVSDYDLFLRISRECTVYGIPESLTYYRRHDSNLSARYTDLFDDLMVLIDTYCASKIITQKLYRKKKSWIFLLKALSSIVSGNTGEGFNSLIKASKISLFQSFHYKLIIFLLLLLPGDLMQKILHRRMRRGSYIN